MLEHDLGQLCSGRRIQIFGHSDFWNFQKRWSIFRLILVVGICWYLLVGVGLWRGRTRQ